MRNLLHQLWRDDGGIVALEYLLVATIVGLGLVVGLSNLEISLDNELSEAANAITALDQSFNFVGVFAGSGVSISTSSKNGTCAVDSFGFQVMSTSAASCATINIVVP